MSRSTQFIGLTDLAERFVGSLIEVESKSCALGMFGEKIALRRWVAPDLVAHLLYPTYLDEEVQCSLWSSGPMIFTYLRLVVDYPGPGGGEARSFVMFEWVHDPCLLERHMQFDRVGGSLWV